ncbi:MAG: hypothetical protein KDA65_03355, partial [Planctomycetaceae bacterium]|nr:hypothetical protein [Planctomycetaceae bacterium]
TGHVFSIYPAADFSTSFENEQVPEFNRETNLWTLSGGINTEFNLEVTLFQPEFLKRPLKTNFERPFVWQLAENNPRERRKIFAETLELPSGLEPLEKLAKEIATQSLERQNMTLSDSELLWNAPQEVVLQVVDDIQSYLMDEANFGYTTELSVSDPEIDPIVDFLVNTKKGHCEYFSSALTLMCRSLNIPARLVTGFKGATRNNFNNRYYVQQADAHAWVEVFAADNSGFDKWYVYDPTPIFEDGEPDRGADSGISFEDIKVAVATFWRSYVVNFSAQQQFEMIVKPLAQKVMQLWELMQEQGVWETLKGVVKTIFTPSYWFSRSGLMVLGVLALIFIVGRKRLRTIFARLFRFWKRGSEADLVRRKTVYFNERFKQICQKQGLVKRKNQTDREFAQQVQDSWKEYLLPHGLQNFPSQLNLWYYQIRFGSKEPETGELGPINEQLERFEQEVKKIPFNPTPGQA